MKAKCIRTNIPFYKEGRIYDITREFVCNDGIPYIEIRIDKEVGMVKQVKSEDFYNGNSDFVAII